MNRRLHAEEVFDISNALYENPRRVDPGETVYMKVRDDGRLDPFRVHQVRAFVDYHYLQLTYQGDLPIPKFKFWVERSRVLCEDVVILREFYDKMRQADNDAEFRIEDLPKELVVYFVTE